MSLLDFLSPRRVRLPGDDDDDEDDDDGDDEDEGRMMWRPASIFILKMSTWENSLDNKFMPHIIYTNIVYEFVIYEIFEVQNF